MSTVLLLVAGVAVGAPEVGHVRDVKPGRVTIDWTAGEVRVVGAGAPDLRAPNPDIARVGAARAAHKDGARRMGEAVRAIPVAGGGTVGDRVKGDAAAAGRVDAVVAKDGDAEYASDGGAMVTLVVPMENVRGALWPVTPGAHGGDGAPTAILVQLEGERTAPALGVTLFNAKGSYAGPVIWWEDAAAAAADPRLGKTVVKAVGHAGADGKIECTLEADKLDAAAGTGGLVVLIEPAAAKEPGNGKTKGKGR